MIKLTRPRRYLVLINVEETNRSGNFKFEVQDQEKSLDSDKENNNKGMNLP